MSDRDLFRPARKSGKKLRVAVQGASGSGKTFTSLLLAHQLIGMEVGNQEGEGAIAVLDTEHGAAKLYSEGDPFWFAHCPMRRFAPDDYLDAIASAERQGFEVLVIDGLSHAWFGAGGIQQIKDANTKGGNDWSGWSVATPEHRRLFEGILSCRIDIIATLRTKTEWVLEGKKPVKVGTKPEQREGVDYEFDVVVALDREHSLTIEKTRCSRLDLGSYQAGDTTVAETLRAWVSSAAEKPDEPHETQAPVIEAGSEPLDDQRIVADLLAMYDGIMWERNPAKAADLLHAANKAVMAALRSAQLTRNTQYHRDLKDANAEAAAHVAKLNTNEDAAPSDVAEPVEAGAAEGDAS